MRKLQIGIIGSCDDLNYDRKAKQCAIEIGRAIAKSDYTLIFGAEKDCDSLPTQAALAARKIGGETVGVTYEKGLEIYTPEAATTVIATGLVRGGGRETVLMLSCDIAVAIAGGSGTLNEVCVAYQANIPVIAVTGFGGWSEKLATTFLDERRRYRIETAKTPEEVMSLIKQITSDK